MKISDRWEVERPQHKLAVTWRQRSEVPETAVQPLLKSFLCNTREAACGAARVRCCLERAEKLTLRVSEFRFPSALWQQ